MKVILYLTLLVSSMNANALLIHTQVTKLSDQQYQADYQIYNDTQGAVDGLMVYFQYGLFDNLSLFSSPADWDVFVAPPEDLFGVQEDGFADALALVAPLQAGDTLNGLSVVFDWLGDTDVITSMQRFETYDANTFEVTSAGEYQLGFTQSVSAPANALFFIALISLIGMISRRNTRFFHSALFPNQRPSNTTSGVAA
ncbi:hypothetical protein FX988_01655 [Paraglaciecola mesophila]|uniref:PEP-CTERM protein-sorting domain-containing protein n=1 Tax=Paraglaciecola mesophila TaxID=197222 RepID=A0A857JII9_9ALTE|nr:hypothetical protein [Paraglaciecola mesophila]QHJ11426.1 hypothetical protein FX988_01655 [Paraglaciecola mesophila]